MNEPIRYRVIFRGHVQGVGFRATTAMAAARLSVVGFVENLPDGTVLLEAEGTPEALGELVAAAEQETVGRVTGRDITKSAATGEFGGRFEVKH